MTTLILLIMLVLLIGLLVLFVYTLLTGAPSVPSKRQAVTDLTALINGRPQRAVDLGSGDGRLMLAVARAGIPVVGYEINPALVAWTWWRIRRQGLQQVARVRCHSFWRADLSDYDLVVLFGITAIMPRLQEKLQRELRPGAQVISNVFTFPDWPVAESRGSVHRYEVAQR